MQNIKKLSDKKVKKIYQIADIHVRKTERHEEYKQVFERLYQKLREDADDSLIVICGDTVHSKNELTPQIVEIMKDLFVKLSRITDVVIILGNHDINYGNNIDSIGPIVLNNFPTKNNIFLLLERGFYQYGDIIFGLTTMHDKEVLSCNINNDLTEFNELECLDEDGSIDCYENYKKYMNRNLQIRTKIALYHGTLKGSKVDSDYSFTNNERFSPNDFKNYDLVMLGDIHKFQYLNKEKTIAYSGSLIQQDFGENLKDHGILKWDLITKKSQFIRIENDYGYVKLTLTKNGFNYQKEMMPKKVKLRVAYRDMTSMEAEQFINELKKEINIIEYSTYLDTWEQNIVVKIDQDNKKVSEIENDKAVIGIIYRYMKDNEQFDDETMEQIVELIKKLLNRISFNYGEKSKSIKIKELKFDNMFIYEEGNRLDFNKFKKIVGLMGPNHSGKSAIIDILLYSIFGKCSRGNRFDLLNKNKKKMNTWIQLDVNGKEFIIERNSVLKNGKDRITTEKLLIYMDGQLINDNNKNKTNNLVEEKICSYDDIVNINFMLQRDPINFIFLSDKIKREIICKILRFDVFDKLLSETLTRLKSQTLSITKLKKIVGDDKELLDQINKLKNQSSLLQHPYNNLVKELENYNKERIEYEYKLKSYVGLNGCDKMTDRMIEKLKNMENNLGKIQKNIVTLTNIINEKILAGEQITEKFKNMTTEYGDIKILKEVHDKEKEQELDQLNEKIKDLLINKTLVVDNRLDLEQELVINKNKYDDNLLTIQKIIDMITTAEMCLSEIMGLVNSEELRRQILESEMNEFKQKNVMEIKMLNEKLNQLMTKKMSLGNCQYDVGNICEQEKIDSEIIINNKSCIDRNIEILQRLEAEKITLFGDDDMQPTIKIIDEEKRKFEIEKDQSIQMLTNRCDTLLANKIGGLNDINIDILMEDLNQNRKLFENSRNLVDDNNNKMNVLLAKMKKPIKPPNIDELYNELCQMIEKEKKILLQIKTLETEKKGYVVKMEKLLNHQYNKDCEACMSNEITKEKIYINETINALDEVINKTKIDLEHVMKHINLNRIYEAQYVNYYTETECYDVYEKQYNDMNIRTALISAENKMYERNINDLEKNIDNIMANQKIDKELEQIRSVIRYVKMNEFNKYNRFLNLISMTEKIIQENILMNSDNRQKNENILTNKRKLEEIELNKKLTEEINQIQTEIDSIQNRKYLKYDNCIKLMSEINELRNKKLLSERETEIFSRNITDIKKKIEIIDLNQTIDEELQKIKIAQQTIKLRKFDLYDRYIELQEQNRKNQERKNAREKELLEIKIKYNSLLNEYNTLKKNYENFLEKKLIEKKLINVKKIQFDLSKEIDLIKKQLDGYDTQLNDANYLYKEFQKNSAELMEREKEKELYQKLVKILDRNGLVDTIIKSDIVPELENKVNHILDSMSDYRIKMEYVGDSIKIYKNVKQILTDITMISGYETTMINMAFRLALSHISTYVKTNFIIIDEGFTYCDKENKKKLSSLFNFIRNNYSWGLVISHDDIIKDQYDMELNIKNNGQYSSVLI